MSFKKSMWLIRLRGSASTQTIGAISNFISNAPPFSCLHFNLAYIFRLQLSAATHLSSHCSARVQTPSSIIEISVSLTSLFLQCISATNIANRAYQMLKYCLVQLMWSPAVLWSLELVRLHCHLEFVTSILSLSCLPYDRYSWITSTLLRGISWLGP
jgi:hypothetical protein